MKKLISILSLSVICIALQLPLTAASDNNYRANNILLNGNRYQININLESNQRVTNLFLNLRTTPRQNDIAFCITSTHQIIRCRVQGISGTTVTIRNEIPAGILHTTNLTETNNNAMYRGADCSINGITYTPILTTTVSNPTKIAFDHRFIGATGVYFTQANTAYLCSVKGIENTGSNKKNVILSARSNGPELSSITINPTE